MKVSAVCSSLLALSLMLTGPAFAESTMHVQSSTESKTESKTESLAPVINTPADSQMMLDDTPENRKNIALKFVKSPAFMELTTKMLDGLVSSVPANAPPDAQAKAKASVQMAKDLLEGKEMETMTVGLLSKHFTAHELDYMLTTQNSPEGRAIGNKMPGFSIELFTGIIALAMTQFTGSMPVQPCPLPTKEEK